GSGPPMKITIPFDQAQADAHLPEAKPDGSGIGVNYADQIVKPFKQTLPDGRKLLLKRRGLKLTLSLGDKQGEAIMRRLDHGPDVKVIFQKALAEAARSVGAAVEIAPGAVHLAVPVAGRPNGPRRPHGGCRPRSGRARASRSWGGSARRASCRQGRSR